MAKLPKTIEPKREGDYILITMPNYWGKGKDYAEAKQALKDSGGRPDKYWRIHSIEPETYVNDYGGIEHKTGHKPMTIAESNPA